MTNQVWQFSDAKPSVAWVRWNPFFATMVWSPSRTCARGAREISSEWTEGNLMICSPPQKVLHQHPQINTCRCMIINVYVYVFILVYIYIYIKKKRERNRYEKIIFPSDESFCLGVHVEFPGCRLTDLWSVAVILVGWNNAKQPCWTNPLDMLNRHASHQLF